MSKIRNATKADLKIIASLEGTCFPPEEACSEKSFEGRLEHFANHFWLLFEDEKLISFADGFCTNQKDLSDEMYENPAMHDENGDWQMIFGVNTHPDFRKKGYASSIIERIIQDSKSQGRKGVVLTCKEEKIPFYAKFGFVSEGESQSNHGGKKWYQMRLSLD